MNEIRHPITIIITFIAMSFAGYVCFSGQTAGLPSVRQTELVFGSAETLNQLTPTLIKLRNKVYESYQRSTAIKKSFAPGDQSVAVTLKGNAINIPEVKLHAMRSALLQTRYPDEQTTIAAISRINPSKWQFNPHYNPYGGVFMYSAGAAIKGASELGFMKLTNDVSYYFSHPIDIQNIYIAPKIFTSFIGLLAIPGMILLGSKRFGLRAGIISSLFLAFTPAVVVEAHCLKPYLMFLPFMVLSLYFAERSLSSDKTSDSIYAGLFAGLSAGTLILSGTVIFAIIAANFFKFIDAKAEKRQFSFLPLAWSIFAAASAFIVTNPFYLLSFHDFAAEMALNSKDVGYSFSINNIITQSWRGLQKTLGLSIYFVSVIGVALAIIRRKRTDIILISAIAPYFIYNLLTLYYNPHYNMPMVPVLLIFASGALVEAYDVIKPRFIVVLAGLVIMSVSAANSIYYSKIFSRANDMYYCAGNWINSAIAEGSSVSCDSYPYFSGPAGYPPFQLLKYQINTSQTPDYYISIKTHSPFQREPNVRHGYHLIRRFEATPNVLDLYFSNELAYFIDQPIEIYKKIDNSNDNS